MKAEANTPTLYRDLTDSDNLADVKNGAKSSSKNGMTISFGFENPLKTRFGESFFRDLPKDPGVYAFIDREGDPLYIGKANNLKQRLMSYQAAKPGQTPDHILEMIEHAHELRLELKSSGNEALKREEELIRSIRPPYNIALNYDVSHLSIAMKVDPKRDAKLRPLRANAKSTLAPIEFRLSHVDLTDKDRDEGFLTFGCFRHRGKTKAAYSALMRLLFAAFCERERFQLPSKICRSSPAYRHTAHAPQEAIALIEAYLAGQHAQLLHYLLHRLLERENFPKQLYLPMQRDLETLKDFFVFGPQDTAKIAKRLRLKSGWVPQDRMDTHLRSGFERSFTSLKTAT